eukprot:11473906-Alexandrium_andersonii.AAC.1
MKKSRGKLAVRSFWGPSHPERLAGATSAATSVSAADPAQAAAEWYQVAATLKKRAVELQVETPYPTDLMPQDVWLALAKAVNSWRFRAEL